MRRHCQIPQRSRIRSLYSLRRLQCSLPQDAVLIMNTLCANMSIYIYIYGTPPHVPTPVFSISALGRDGFLSCRTAWVNGRKSACKSYVSSSSSSAKLSPRTQIGRIQTYSKRILLNTPRIQDSRFKVPGRTLPCTLNLESWIRGVFNRIRFEYV